MAIKKQIKNLVRLLLFYIKRKPYKIRYDKKLVALSNDQGNDSNEFFFGYYDRSPELDGMLLYHEMMKDGKSVNIVVEDMLTKKRRIIGNSTAFNWQMGARSIWIDNDTVSYNTFEHDRYICKWFSLSEDKVIRTFDYPLQDYSKEFFFLGVNYQRLRSYAKEYAYYCLPEMSENEYEDYTNDGIWKTDVPTGKSSLLVSIEDILDFEPVERFNRGRHFVNHIMISPAGKSFIFIHRYYVNGKRFDRLMYYDFQKLKCLMDGRVQSHYCWIDNHTVFGYGEYKAQKGFYYIDVKTGEVTKDTTLTEVHPKDGHPTAHGDWVVVDDYLDLSRIQTLLAYNRKTHEIVKLCEFFHDLKHKEFNRCDLHPRFSADGKNIYVDTIYSGRRELLGLSVPTLTGGGKTLVLMDTLYKMYNLDGKERKGIRVLPLMRNSKQGSRIYRLIRKLHLSSAIGCKEIWLADWKNILWQYNTVIMGETGNTYNVARFIKQEYPNKRVIIWYRNSVEQSVKPRKKDEQYELWSFDISDCKKYGLKYNPQFYMKSPAYKDSMTEYDALFVGKDKGRLKDILQLEKDLQSQGLKTKFLIVGYNTSMMEYSDILDYISKSKAIVDFQGDWQHGITLRPLEALFYGKNLITNSKEVEKTDFYRTANVFCTYKDNISNIRIFLDTPLDVIPDEVIAKYDLTGWVERFKNKTDGTILS